MAIVSLAVVGSYGVSKGFSDFGSWDFLDQVKKKSGEIPVLPLLNLVLGSNFWSMINLELE